MPTRPSAARSVREPRSRETSWCARTASTIWVSIRRPGSTSSSDPGRSSPRDRRGACATLHRRGSPGRLR
jgi:hypothetical protein